MSQYRGPWQIVPPDIEGWHEQGYDVRSADNEVLCRDCINEEVAVLFASSAKLLEAVEEFLSSPLEPLDLIAIDGMRRAALKARGASGRVESSIRD